MTDTPPADFVGETYLKLNPDVAAAGADPEQHYLQFGRHEGRAYRVNQRVEAQTAIAVPFDFAQSSTAKIGVFCHIFYMNLLGEVASHLSNLPDNTDLLLTTNTIGKVPAIQEAFAGWTKGSVNIAVAPNRGRDIAPKLISFADRYADYDLVLHMHTKNSPHHSELSRWRAFLYKNLCGSETTVQSIVQCFEAAPDLGMVIPQHFEFLRPFIHWGKNLPGAQLLASDMGIALVEEAEIDFPSGSMFWARPAALKPLLDLKLSFEDFPYETGQIDVTPAHAIERLYLEVCHHAGYRAIKTAVPDLYTEVTTIASVRDRSSLPEAIRHYSV